MLYSNVIRSFTRMGTSHMNTAGIMLRPRIGTLPVRGPSCAPMRHLRKFPSGGKPKVERPPPMGRVKSEVMIRCGLFTLTGTAGIFIGCAFMLWDPEADDDGDFRKQLERRIRKNNLHESWLSAKWRHLFIKVFDRPPNSADSVFWSIAALNGLVFLAWRIPRLRPTMVKYFTSSPYGAAPVSSMMLSTFSHHGVFHLLLNMYILHNFTPSLVAVLGKEQFMALYLAGGLISSYISIAYRAALRLAIPSLGASGAIMAVLGSVFLIYPHRSVEIIFIADIFPHAIPMDTAAMCILAFESLGMIFRWQILDHAAHLGGMLFGMAFAYAGKQ